MKKVAIFMVGVLLTASLSGCYTRVVVPPGPPPAEVQGVAPYQGAIWVPGHYNWRGFWIPGHWR